MFRLSRWFPSACSRLRIFICYAREDAATAREIGQALTNDGHDVFVDANSLKVATDFNQVIRRAIERADRFIFLASRHSLDKGAYPQTELNFAQKRWPSPMGAVWPVIVDSSVDAATLPTYLRAVQIHTPVGNIVADLAAEIESSRTVRPAYLIGAAAIAVMALGLAVVLSVMGDQSTNFSLQTPQQVDFRPSSKPGPGTEWHASKVALTVIPVNYSNDGATSVRIVDEVVNLQLRDREVGFKWHNEVEMRSDCGTDWLCTKTSIGTSTLEPGSTLRRETMFVPKADSSLSWKDFVGLLCRSTYDTLNVKISTEAKGTGLFASGNANREAVCRIDLAAMRGSLQKSGCQDSSRRLPVRLSPKCLQ